MRSVRQTASALLSPLARRRTLDAALDRMRFRIDTTSRHGNYQPLPGFDVKRVYRQDATHDRWNVMRPLVERHGVRSAVDVGCNAGYFPLQFGLMGIPAVGIEGEAVKFRTLMYAASRLELKNSGQFHMWVTPETVCLVPSADCLVLLAVWHHFVKNFGLENASTMLACLWRRTEKILFFETGEMEVAEHYRLPDMGHDSRAWLTRYLSETCVGGDVHHLGLHDAMSPRGMPCRRNLFAVVRTSVAQCP